MHHFNYLQLKCICLVLIIRKWSIHPAVIWLKYYRYSEKNTKQSYIPVSFCRKKYQTPHFLNKRFYAPCEMEGDRAVSRSVNQVSSPQHLLPTSFESCQTWYRGRPDRVDVPYWFSCYIWSKVKAGLCTNVLLTSLLDRWKTVVSIRFPLLIFRSRSQRKRSNCWNLYKMSFDPFLWEF